jgi:hypothetical protein
MSDSHWTRISAEDAQALESKTKLKNVYSDVTTFTSIVGSRDLSGNTIVWPWRQKTSLFLLFFSIAWTITSCIGIIGTSFSLGSVFTLDAWVKALSRDPAAMIMGLFPLIGIAIFYAFLALYYNKSKFTVTSDGLSVESGPLPWPNSKFQIQSANISQLYVQIYSTYERNETSVKAYRVVLQETQGHEYVIASGFPTYREARILEQWLENKLAIKDKAISGETA